MANIIDKINAIRQAVFGKDVRSSIADGIEAINEEVESTTERQTDLEATFGNLIINAGNSNAEIVDARYDSVNNENHATLKERMDSQSAALAEIPNQSYITEKAKQIDLEATDAKVSILVATANTSFYEKTTSGVTGALLVVTSGATTGQINLASVTPVATGYTPVAGDYVRLVYGVASGSSELISTRTDTQGNTFATVPNRVDNIEKVLTEDITKVSFGDWELGVIDVNGNVVNNTRIRTAGYKSFPIGTVLTITPLAGYKFGYYRYSEGYTSPTGVLWLTAETILPIEYPYYRFLIARVDGAVMTPSESVNVTFKKKAPSIAKVTQLSDKMSQVIKPINLLNKNNLLANYAILTGGVAVPSVGISADLNFDPVDPLNTYSATDGDWYISLYDANKQFTRLVTGTTNVKFTTTGSERYMRKSLSDTYKDTAMLVKGTTLPSQYTPGTEMFIDGNKLKYGSEFGDIQKILYIVKQGGTVGVDCDYTDLRACVHSILDSSYYKRYDVLVLDGVYDYSDNGDDIGLYLRDYVNVIGIDKSRVIIKKLETTFTWAKAAVDVLKTSDIEYTSIQNCTIISNNCKCPLHIDIAKMVGTFEGINLDLINTQTKGTGDYPTTGSPNCFAVGSSGKSSRFILKNVRANGKIWGHNWVDTHTECTFEFINCTAKRIAFGDLTSNGNDHVIVKGCKADIFEMIWFNDYPSSKPYQKPSYDFVLEGNEISRTLLSANSGTHNVLTEYYNGKYPFNIAGIHTYCYSTENIAVGDTVYKVASDNLWEITKTNNGNILGRAVENISNNMVLVEKIS